MNELDLYSKMYLLRRAETVISEYYFTNKIFSFVHFYIGQEAVAVGVSAHLALEDRVFGNHRSHGHYLAKGGDLSAMYSEMLGKSSGCCKGKGGSMHMLDRNVGFMGSTPILASAVPIAAGSALQQKMKQLNSITVVYLGDGAAEEGVFYETLNFASLMQLPMLFVIENNLYSVNSPRENRKSDKHSYRQICEGLGVDYYQADGNDVNSMFQTSGDAISSIKKTRRPALIEAITFRHLAHSAPIRDDKSGYRIIDTEEVRVKNDSLLKLRSNVEKTTSQENILKIEKAIDSQIQDALNFAIKSPEPMCTELELDVFF